MSDHNERACPQCGNLTHYSCGDARIERAYGVKCSAPNESLTEEDLTDDALEGRDPAEEIRRERSEHGDLFDSESGEVLEDAPGWDKVTRTILNNEGCDWAGGRLREKHGALDECHRMYDAEVARIQAQCDRLMSAAEARLAKATNPLHQAADFLENIIRVYVETHRAEVLKGLRTKSRTFPSGLKVGWSTKAKGGEYRWRKDMAPKEREEALLAWALKEETTTGDLLTKAEWSADRKAVEKHLGLLDEADRTEALEGDSAPPGLEYVEEHEELTVTVKE